MLSYLCVGALVVQMLAIYMIWPSRWNVPAHLSLGFCVTAYIIPGLFTNVWNVVSQSVIEIYAWINILGAISIVLGVFLGKLLSSQFKVPFHLRKVFEVNVDVLIGVRAKRLILLGILGISLAYLVMGFVPMFADDPFSAKQFKGEYFEPYYRAAYLFRFSFSVLTACIPIVLIFWRNFNSNAFLFLGVTAVVLISISLARASTASGVILFLGLMAAWNKRWFVVFILFVGVVYPLGSAGYLLLGLFLGVEKLTSIYSIDSIFDIVASGAPDIYDQLVFLERFLEIENFTYGRTFLGGLIPGNYMWNPSVWSITFDNLGADISEIVTGGLRFSVAIWGYASFGWVGVFLVPLFSGIISGIFISFLKRLPLNKSLVGAALVILLYMTLGKQLAEFYMLSIHSLPSIFCMLYLFYYRTERVGVKTTFGKC